MMQQVNTTTHNGMPSYWLDQAGLCTGALTFGVGMGHEPAALAGITHLVEHLILRMVQPVTLYHGGVTKADSVEFFAAGEGEAVGAFLNAIAAAVSDIATVTEEDLKREKAGVEAEDPRAFSSVSGGLLTYRFGTTGLGAAQFGAPATAGLARTEVIEWVRLWLTAGNAAVAFTGPVPSSLDIRLPAGIRPECQDASAVASAPRLVRSRKAGVAHSMLVPPSHAGLLAQALRYELLWTLSHHRGLIYSVMTIETRIDGDWSQVDLVLDPVDRNTGPTLTASMDCLRAVAEAGFSDAAVEFARNQCLVELDWDDKVPSEYLDQLAIDCLLGRATPPRQAMVDNAKNLTSAELTAVLGAALPSLIVAVDRAAALRKADIGRLGLTNDPYRIWQPHNEAGQQQPELASDGHRVWRGKTSSRRLWFTETHLVRRKSGKTKSIVLADVAVVGDRSCGCISLMDRRGRNTELDMGQWKGGKKLRQRLLAAFPAAIVRPFPED